MKVGKYDIPNIRLHPTLFEATKTMYEKFGADEASDQLTVAQLLGHKTDKSGAFISKLADLRSYGLITSRGIKVTDMGKKLTYDPSDKERNNALKEALLNVPLWKEFFSRFGKSLPTSDFWVELTKITGLEAPEAKRVEETVKNAYLADFQYLKEEKEPEKGGKGMEGADNINRDQAKPATLEELKFGDNVRIWLPKENIQEAWKKAKRMIDIYLGVEKHKEEG
jgi:hypothetical protein